MSNELLFIITGIATYQAARLIGLEKGPADVFLNLRSTICDYFQSNKQTKWLCDGICCPVCLSFWFGWLFASAIVFPWQEPAAYIITALSLGGFATALYKISG